MSKPDDVDLTLDDLVGPPTGDDALEVEITQIADQDPDEDPDSDEPDIDDSSEPDEYDGPTIDGGAA